MISFDPFWKTLKLKGISTYILRQKYGISSETLHRLKHGKSITTTKINDLCNILRCDVSEILEYIPDKTFEEIDF